MCRIMLNVSMFRCFKFNVFSLNFYRRRRRVFISTATLLKVNKAKIYKKYLNYRVKQVKFTNFIMGCDGGTIPRRDELVRLKKKPEQVKNLLKNIFFS